MGVPGGRRSRVYGSEVHGKEDRQAELLDLRRVIAEQESKLQAHEHGPSLRPCLSAQPDSLTAVFRPLLLLLGGRAAMSGLDEERARLRTRLKKVGLASEESHGSPLLIRRDDGTAGGAGAGGERAQSE